VSKPPRKKKKKKKAPPTLTPLGKALRARDAYLRSGWDSYRKAARAGDVRRFVYLLRAHRPLTGMDFDARGGVEFDPFADADFDALADALDDAIEAAAKRSRGAPRDEAVHEAVQIAEWIMPKFERSERGRTFAIEIACGLVERKYGAAPINREQVYDLLRRPKSRRRPKSTP
jgi:hypothetical protein